jgi:hypothetical protein
MSQNYIPKKRKHTKKVMCNFEKRNEIESNSPALHTDNVTKVTHFNICMNCIRHNLSNRHTEFSEFLLLTDTKTLLLFIS